MTTAIGITDPEIPDLHRAMVAGRALDRGLDELSARWSKHWFTAVGEDGVIVGASYGLRAGDVVAPHWRGGLIAAMVRGAPIDELIAACLGTAASYNRGRFRGDWSAPFEYGLLGAYSGNLGPDVAYGTGAAWAMQMQERDNVAVVILGDGTAHRGEVHESMNFAGLRRLPVVFVVQNNQFTICTPLQKQTACRTFADRGIGYGMPGIRVDGNDVLLVRGVMREAVARARAGDGPTLIDAVTYRAQGGYGKLPRREQPADEIAEWLQKDPLDRLEKAMLAASIATADELAEVHRRAAGEISAAIERAEKVGPAPLSDLDPALVFAPAR
ncbi:MAG: thiamine pyrophosphate-dependent dehydrogenase E1 component subunit alpha [Gammaproteobacteria bacterium]|nr:MAG: thiamine pyrophosphate-dependent dehydrogenase E1 component subunit alpha [Gammaproteobacteria bacterium]